MFQLLLHLLFICGQVSSYEYCITTADKITFHYKNERTGDNIGLLESLVNHDRTIRFAMNGSMYTSPNHAPVGLYIENGVTYSKKEISNNPRVNFGIAPQAIFYIDKKGKPGFVKAQDAREARYKYAVELAPFLLSGGEVNLRIKDIHSKYIRNAIGLLKDGRILLIISTRKVTMEQLALKMKDLGCATAAYVDGGVSESWQKGEPFATIPGAFAVMVAAHE